MKVWNLDNYLKKELVTIVYGFSKGCVIIISDVAIEPFKVGDYIEFGIQKLKICYIPKEFSIPDMDSTINIHKNIYCYEVENE